MRFFMDFRVEVGALSTIILAMYRFKSEQRWRKFDFTINKVRSVIRPPTRCPHYILQF